MNSMFIVALSSFCGFMLGLALTKRSRERERYYHDCVRLISYLISNISYKADKIGQLLDEARVDSDALRKNVREYKAYIDGGQFSLSQNCLTKGEAAVVKDFFCQLGRYDGETQLNELKRRAIEFEQKYAEEKEKNGKQGNMYVKLGILFGLLVGILLI